MPWYGVFKIFTPFYSCFLWRTINWHPHPAITLRWSQKDPGTNWMWIQKKENSQGWHRFFTWASRMKVLRFFTWASRMVVFTEIGWLWEEQASEGRSGIQFWHVTFEMSTSYSRGHRHHVLENDPFFGWENKLDNQSVSFKSSVCLSPRRQRSGSIILISRFREAKPHWTEWTKKKDLKD